MAEGELLPIIKETEHPCFECAKCCKYVAVEIDEPTTNKEYDYIIWYVVHSGVSVFVDWENAWYIKFDTRCDKLTPEGLCGIYEDRPAICRDFDWRDCEQHVTEEEPDKWAWDNAEDFIVWLEKKRPKAYKKFHAYREKKKRKGEEEELLKVKVKITDLPGPPDGTTPGPDLPPPPS